MRGLSGCQSCPRLAAFRAEQKRKFPHYHCLPVAPIGARDSRLLIVGLAPGLHGANASGRPFTGDASGRMLFDALYRFGFADRPGAPDAAGPVALHGCRITNAVKCLPPQNRPLGDEIRRCNRYLRAEIAQLADGAVLLALGALAHRAVVAALGGVPAQFRFAHLALHRPARDRLLLDSYHCSRYNVNTGRLTTAMFDAVFVKARQLLT